MPGLLSESDKKLFFWAAGLTLLLSAVTVILAPPVQEEQSSVPSSYSSASGGARAAYLLLEELHYPVRRWEEPPGQLAGLDAILILAEPSIPPVPNERDGLRRFVSGGGRVLFCGAHLDSYFAGAEVETLEPSRDWNSSSAKLPSRFTRSAPVISMRIKARWTKLTGRQLPLYVEKDNPDIVLWRIGKGEILWWAAASPLTNAGITRANNLNLLLNTVSSPAPRAIYWDEYFHGSRSSLWSYVEATPVKWAIVQIALLFAAALFSFSRRSGPVAVPRAPSRLSPLEFVDTLGSLYQRAGVQGVAVGVPYRHLRWSLARRLRLASETSDDLLAQAAAERLGWDHASIYSALYAGAQSQTKKIAARDALRVVQTIQQFTARLRIAQPKMEHA